MSTTTDLTLVHRPATRRLFGWTRNPARRALRDAADQLGGARLLIDMHATDEAQTVVTTVQRTLRGLETRDRHQRTALAIGALLAALVVAGTVLVTARPAAAAVTSAPPVRVVVDSRTPAVTATVRTNAALNGWHGASLWVGYPDAPAMTLAGAGTSRTALVSVRGHLDARRITTWGHLDAVTVDDADGRGRAITLDVRRRSSIRLTHAEVRPGGRVALAVRLTHYDPATGGYISSRLSPVTIQERTPVGWANRAQAVTNGDGLAGTIVAAAPGARTYRAFRPDGATVWGATSTPLTARVPGSAAC